MSVKRQGMRIVFLATLMTIFLASTGFAAEESTPEAIEAAGFVSVIMDSNDVILSVELVTDEEIFEVVLDEKGLELGQRMADKDVEVEGVISEGEDQELWLKVRTFKALKEEQ